MPQTFSTTGGARVGMTNASWPLARLSATSEALTISVSLFGGTYTFAPDQVAELERYTMIPILGWGIRVRHCRSDYPEKIIFWCLGSPDGVLEGIREAGFCAKASPSEVVQPRGPAIRWAVIVIGIGLWNGLFWLDFARSGHLPGPMPGMFSLAALALLFAFSIGTLFSPAVQRLVLKPGRSVNEARSLLSLLALVSGLLLVVFSILTATGALAPGS